MWHRNCKKVIWMTGPGSWISAWVLFGCAVTSLGTGQQTAVAGHPPTPLPCAAEGVCLPNRATWGWNQTRWRPWPGDKAGLQPTQSATPAEDAQDEVFPPFEHPPAEDEDLRGSPSKKKESTESESTAPAEEALPELPASELQGFRNPRRLPAPQQSQGMNEVTLRLPVVHDADLRPSNGLMQLETKSLQIQPSANGYSAEPAKAISTESLQEDLPPNLPTSLLQLTSGFRIERHHALPAKRTPWVAQENRMKKQPQAAPAAGVVPATWQQTPGIQLINPAAAISSAADGDELRHAIYYEAADQ
ncbi:MAG: hypothetical protein ABGX16_08290 [Pirellulales bacterium]